MTSILLCNTIVVSNELLSFGKIELLPCSNSEHCNNKYHADCAVLNSNGAYYCEKCVDPNNIPNKFALVSIPKGGNENGLASTYKRSDHDGAVALWTLMEANHPQWDGATGDEKVDMLRVSLFCLCEFLFSMIIYLKHHAILSQEMCRELVYDMKFKAVKVTNEGKYDDLSAEDRWGFAVGTNITSLRENSGSLGAILYCQMINFARFVKTTAVMEERRKEAILWQDLQGECDRSLWPESRTYVCHNELDNEVHRVNKNYGIGEYEVCKKEWEDLAQQQSASSSAVSSPRQVEKTSDVESSVERAVVNAEGNCLSLLNEMPVFESNKKYINDMHDRVKRESDDGAPSNSSSSSAVSGEAVSEADEQQQTSNANQGGARVSVAMMIVSISFHLQLILTFYSDQFAPTSTLCLSGFLCTISISDELGTLWTEN